MKDAFVYIYTALSLLASPSHAKSEKLISASGKNKVQMLELYSSESCSSCPPADKWISELKNHSELWKNFVPVVFHVDYWNHLGWKDDYSSEPMTKRQIELSSHWVNPSVYTPGMILDGKEWTNWRTNENHKLPIAEKSLNILISLFSNSDNTYRVEVEGLQPAQKYIVRIAQLGMSLKTKITSGENSGKTLEHNFVVINWDYQNIDSKKRDVQFKINTVNSSTKLTAIVAWIEKDGNPTPLQATGGYL